LNTITLTVGGSFGTHRGELKHDEIIGKQDGSVVTNQNGVEYLALKPLLADYVLSMKRGATIIYPKDAGAILTQADIFPDAKVVEAGVGSGALALFILRAIGAGGFLHSFELREDFAKIAQRNVEGYFQKTPENWQLHLGALQDNLATTCQDASVDRVILDMLSPWECLEVSSKVLKPGGVLLCYVASVTQLSRVAEEIRRLGGFTEPEASETLFRHWHLQGLAVRPEHRMIGHTGFLISARKLAPNMTLPKLSSTKKKVEFSEEDLSHWTGLEGN